MIVSEKSVLWIPSVIKFYRITNFSVRYIDIERWGRGKTSKDPVPVLLKRRLVTSLLDFQPNVLTVVWKKMI
jgi:hypothetical protein